MRESLHSGMFQVATGAGAALAHSGPTGIIKERMEAKADIWSEGERLTALSTRMEARAPTLVADGESAEGAQDVAEAFFSHWAPHARIATERFARRGIERALI